MDTIHAPDVVTIVEAVLVTQIFPHIDKNRVVCMRSYGAKSRARARIWSFPKIWQNALNLPARYVIEVIAHQYDSLSKDDKTRVIIHELMHIPKNFSGALVPHRGKYHRIDKRTVEKMFKAYAHSHTRR